MATAEAATPVASPEEVHMATKCPDVVLQARPWLCTVQPFHSWALPVLLVAVNEGDGDDDDCCTRRPSMARLRTSGKHTTHP